MLIKPRYSARDLLLWTRRELLTFLGLAALVTGLHDLVGFNFLQVPWAPIAVLGTAVAFIVGFQNNAAYGRIWEARKIWGGIVNVSRTWGMQTLDMVHDPPGSRNPPEFVATDHEQLIHRHVAWLTALSPTVRDLELRICMLFVLLLPFAAVPEFAKVGTNLADAWPALAEHFIWASVPFCALLSWIFHTMERIGRAGENPFEGTANDVPISTIARGIEIDLRQMLGEPESKIPAPLPAKYDVQM